ncbi:MAG: methylmalonyl Co-A mutase-associated GTPase MeaB [Acidobacteria bacterium]|nr:methylmalonyl Co-A mutase-associated GTPase MeaB [Acidobacteriota bacterium]NIM63134.1 methylmalonyl Co-A mutase-associated GTPase MeaB [Acidobacteriota bacterium]NIO58401.1 methylmalonyl Co-A mutase-associated GTPase MeaB [Acidobacteriota bacterium]NIQ29448.1 methylmalonyl Co-A mutase-associated GTPase MeaB [Acidobacteriota bacterium]NIQ84100.1 methylmalonyl Co-A mutase-associated GTPase MeaB [Acidobacteriota bacterium]
MKTAGLSERLLDGDPRALARAISLAEENAPRAIELLRDVFPRTGRARVLGVTGSPGAGKSSLVDQLIAHYRKAGRRVGVIAVDPSSAYSGGAILGDRVRMQRHASDGDVFIRSMATRGHLGGLARASNDAIDLLDAAGFDPVLVETVGVGQDEVDVVKTADAVAVVLVPGMGDDIQAIKAGILEIADLFVINKADRDGADRLQADLDYMLTLGDYEDRPRPKVLRTIAVRDEGVEHLRDEFDRFLEREQGQRLERRRERSLARLLSVLAERLMARTLERVLVEDRMEQLVEAIAERRVDPYTAVEGIVEELEGR